jgi:DnaK suppressor protein
VQDPGLDVPLKGEFTTSMHDEDYSHLVGRFRPRLEAELAEIDKLDAENASWSAPVELDQQSVGRVSRIDAMQMQAMSQAVQRRRSARRVAIQHALRRIDEGDYGFCIECGEPIAPGRLDVDPTFPACVRCAK